VALEGGERLAVAVPQPRRVVMGGGQDAAGQPQVSGPFVGKGGSPFGCRAVWPTGRRTRQTSRPIPRRHSHRDTGLGSMSSLSPSNRRFPGMGAIQGIAAE
jgi:hypothetical protein